MNGIKFRDSLKGYNKEDVNKYITGLDSEFRKSEALLSAKVAAYEKKLSENSAIPAETAERLNAAEKRVAELEAELEALKNENEKLRNAVESDEESRAKAQLYDKMSCQLGDVLLHAGDAAEAMLKNAENEAKRINGEAEELKRTTSDKLRMMIEEANTVIKTMSEESLTALNDYNKDVRKTLDDISETLRVKSETMQKSLENGNKELYEKMLCDIERIYGEAASGLNGNTEADGKDM